MERLTFDAAIALAARALRGAGANDAMADCTARARVLAEAQGIGSHGLARVAQYATHLRNGRADGAAVAVVARRKGAALLSMPGRAWPSRLANWLLPRRWRSRVSWAFASPASRT